MKWRLLFVKIDQKRDTYIAIARETEFKIQIEAMFLKARGKN